MTIKTLTRLANSNRRIPILQQIKVEKKKMTATDMDFWITAPAPNWLGTGMYYREGFDKGIQIKSDLPVKDFPPVVKSEGKNETHSAELGADAIDALRWVMKAASTAETRYYLNGAFFDWSRPQGVIVATDGHRLHSFNHDIEGNRPEKKKMKFNGKWRVHYPVSGAILPSKAVKLILDVVKENKLDSFTITFKGLTFTAKIGKTLVEGKLIDGTYPDWRRVVPKHPKANTTEFDPAEIKAIIPTLDTLAKIAGDWRKLTTAVALEKGKALPTRTVPDGPQSWPVKINLPGRHGFNARYLSDICAGEVAYGEPSSPMMVKGKQGTVKVMAVLMPLRV